MDAVPRDGLEPSIHGSVSDQSICEGHNVAITVTFSS
jgi:hypothetical protein